MAQIRTLKINANGFTEEHGNSDDVTYATVTGSTSLNVTSGTTITNNITFNAVTDTIAGIQNQNLLDKTANETISGNYTIQTGSKLILDDQPTLGTHAANKDYVDSTVQGISWQEPIINQVDFTTAEPGSPTVGDRYINTVTGTSSGTAQSVTANYIYEWNGSTWTELVPSEGWAVWDETQNAYYVFNGASWVKFGNVVDHNNLSNLQGGNGSTEYYHLTAAEDTFVAAMVAKIAAGGDVVANNVNDTLSAIYTVSGEMDVATGDLVLPNSTMGAPEEGSIYWDNTNDRLNVYNGTEYVTFDPNGEQTIYTAGTGGIAQYDAVYISANDTVLKADASATATSRVIGFAPDAISAASTGPIQEDGVLKGVLTAATAGDPYYLATTAGTISTTVPTGTGQYVIRVGYAKNATDLQIQIQQVGRRA